MRCSSFASLSKRGALRSIVFSGSLALVATAGSGWSLSAANANPQFGVPPDTVNWNLRKNLPVPSGPENIYNDLNNIDLDHCRNNATADSNTGCYARICLPVETATRWATLCQHGSTWNYFSSWAQFGGLCTTESFQDQASNGSIYKELNIGSLGSGFGDSQSQHQQLCANERTEGDGCFAPESQILLSDGSTKAAEEIFAGDLLYSPGQQGPLRVVKIIESGEAEPLIEYGYGDFLSKVTLTHPVLTQNGLKQARALTVDDYVQDQFGNYNKLDTVGLLPVEEGQIVINFILEAVDGKNDHLLVADGMVTGDLILQQRLSRSLAH